MDATPWYRLDNVGKFYAAQAGSFRQTVFRFSAEMTQCVDSKRLQAALDRAVRLYPGFNVTLRSGFFWHYLEQSQDIPEVREESLPICFRMHDDHSSVLFRVSFHESRINLEVSHMISDGRGSLEFFKVLVGLYVEECYGVSGVITNSESTVDEKVEDSFTRNYEASKAASTFLPKAARITGWRDDVAPTYMEYHLRSSEVHSKAKEMGVSVTSLLIAAVMSAVGKGLSTRQRRRDMCINVPVDLRRYYGSETLRNFFGLSYVMYPAEGLDASLDDIASSIQGQLAQAVEPEAIKRRMNRMVKLERSPFLRFAPLFMKDVALSVADKMSARDVTTTVSNLGVVRLPEFAAPYVRAVNVLTSTNSIDFTACSFAGDMSIGISSIYVSNDIARELCRTFSAMGIHGYVNINKDAAETEALLKQARLEHALAHTSRREDDPS